MDRTIYIISDTHFGHANILNFKDKNGVLIRPEFKTIQEHDQCLLDNWNSVVRPEDIVYHLGDVYFKSGDIIRKLNGRKRLLLGNHDNGKDPLLQDVFQKIGMWRMFPELECVLTHTPQYLANVDFSYHKYRFSIHGHIHDKPAPTPYHFNVSAENIGYKPVDLESVVAKLKAANKESNLMVCKTLES